MEVSIARHKIYGDNCKVVTVIVFAKTFVVTKSLVAVNYRL